MGALRPWQELAPAGVVTPDEGPRVRTGNWRTGELPLVDFGRCVDCLLCWLYCPDSAIVLDGHAFAGIDHDVCKGCGICAERCPTGAIGMAPEVSGRA